MYGFIDIPILLRKKGILRIVQTFVLKKIIAGLTSISISLFASSAHAFGGSGPFEGLAYFARRVTIGIETPVTSGSGVIIGRKGNKYFFLTAKHVASGNPESEEFTAYSLLGERQKRYKISKFIKPNVMEGKDIVIGVFESSDALEQALIFSIDVEKFVPPPPKLPSYTSKPVGSMNGRQYNTTWDIQGPPLIAGVSVPTAAITVPIFRYTPGQIQTRAPGNLDGYEMIYNAVSTVRGMSGGGVFAARMCPEFPLDSDNPNRQSWGAYPGLIAIHGRSEEYANSGGRSGVSLGVPIDLFVDYLGKNARKYGILTGSKYYNEMARQCVNHSMY